MRAYSASVYSKLESIDWTESCFVASSINKQMFKSYLFYFKSCKKGFSDRGSSKTCYCFSTIGPKQKNQLFLLPVLKEN